MTSIWSADRRPRGAIPSTSSVDGTGINGERSAFQHDYDRLLFSTPVRRLADKTQVWPMDNNDGVRTRLTHSHEVANLARSIGTKVHYRANKYFSGVDLHNVIQPILSAIGLAHDLGNPPFGHQGEAAIGAWFKIRNHWIFTHFSANGDHLNHSIPEILRSEFEHFDGNPQSLRLVGQLQTHQAYMGLDLTAATIAGLLKYPVSAQNRDPRVSIAKKVGYFDSEREIVDWCRKQTGLSEAQRHPLTWIMEACDDIAYSVLDVDDLLKKSIISPDDVYVALKHDARVKGCDALPRIETAFQRVNDGERGAVIGRDIKISYLRAILMDNLIEHASNSFTDRSEYIFALTQTQPLMESNRLCDTLKDIAKQYGHNHPDVLRAEAVGGSAISKLMSAFWEAITDRADQDDIKSRRISATSRFIFSLISPNYVEAASRSAPQSMRYRELRLLTDMVSGMTDTFAMRIWCEIQKVQNASRP